SPVLRSGLLHRRPHGVMMNQSLRDYDLNIPDAFWSVIADARQDVHALNALLRKEDMDREKLATFHDYYKLAVEELIPYCREGSRGWDEGDIENAASWVVAHGREHYLAVWHNLNLLPNPYTIRPMSYLSTIEQVFYDRFGEWR